MSSILRSLIACFSPGPRVARVVIDAAGDDWKTYRKVTKAMETLAGARSAVLELEVIKMNRMNPTVLLSLRDILVNRPSFIKLRVRIMTNLIDGSILFPMIADQVHIRSGAWFQFASIEEIEKKTQDSDEEGETWKSGAGSSFVNTVKEPSAITDYRAMTKILGEYLPLVEFKDKRLPLEETLKEFNLLRDPKRDAELASLFEGRSESSLS